MDKFVQVEPPILVQVGLLPYPREVCFGQARLHKDCGRLDGGQVWFAAAILVEYPLETSLDGGRDVEGVAWVRRRRRRPHRGVRRRGRLGSGAVACPGIEGPRCGLLEVLCWMLVRDDASHGV